ncbi:MAG TPA: multicopper oxidase domain-containing protein, partial [Candidatus Cybelea sp.]
HFHGIGSSPKAPGDDVLGTLARPGESLHYVVHIPKNQEPGLYWYHPHVHGQTAFQVGSAGMSGAIIVNGLEHHLPGLAKMRERLIIVRAVGIGATLRRRGGDDDMPGMDGMATPQRMKPQAYNTEPCGSDLGFQTTLNGAYQPVITIRPGEKQFFRVINASGHKTLKLDVGSRMELVAIDGFALDSWPGTPPTKMVQTLVIPPAARAEFVVTGPRGGFGTFKTLCFDSGIVGDRDPQLKLATLRAPRRQGEQSREMGDEPLTVGAPLPSNVYTTALPPIAAKRTVTFSEGPNRFFINGKAFSMSDPPTYVVHTGTVEEWHIHNTSPEVHDFHIHQLHFLVKEIDGVKVTHPYWADSQLIPHLRRDGSPGSLVLIMDFRDPKIKGTFLFHCHILDHEDLGMMAKIQAI